MGSSVVKWYKKRQNVSSGMKPEPEEPDMTSRTLLSLSEKMFLIIICLKNTLIDCSQAIRNQLTVWQIEEFLLAWPTQVQWRVFKDHPTPLGILQANLGLISQE